MRLFEFIFAENLVEHDFDVVAGVPGADALPHVLADRQVSPTVLSSSLFRHERSLRGKFVSVNSAFTSFRRGQQRAAFPVPPAGSRRKSASRRRARAPRRRKGWRSPRRFARFGGHWKTRQRLGLSTLRRN